MTLVRNAQYDCRSRFHDNGGGAKVAAAVGEKLYINFALVYYKENLEAAAGG